MSLCVQKHPPHVFLMCANPFSLSPEAGRPDAALHTRGEHVQPLVCAVGPGRRHTLQCPGERKTHTVCSVIAITYLMIAM